MAVTFMSDLLNKVSQNNNESQVLEFANKYLAALKTGSKEVLAKLLEEAEYNALLKKTIIDFNRPLALLVIQRGIDINADDPDILFRLTLNYPETSQAILEVLQPADKGLN